MYASVVIRPHAVHRMAERVPEYAGIDLEIVFKDLEESLAAAVSVGPQCGQGTILEVCFPVSSEKYYLVGNVKDGKLVLSTVLTNDLLQVNLQRNGLNVGRPIKRHRRYSRSRRRVVDNQLKTERPWKIDKHMRDKPAKRSKRGPSDDRPDSTR